LGVRGLFYAGVGGTQIKSFVVALLQTGKLVVNVYVGNEVGRHPGSVISIGDVTGRAWHAGAAASALLLATPRNTIMHLAHPTGIETAGTFVLVIGLGGLHVVFAAKLRLAIEMGRRPAGVEQKRGRHAIRVLPELRICERAKSGKFHLR
jgi:hypothetical protein